MSYSKDDLSQQTAHRFLPENDSQRPSMNRLMIRAGFPSIMQKDGTSMFLTTDPQATTEWC